ncbi:MAG: DUF1552 domain-containing protein [Myxococcales bacterium]|nr:DUF1552 domain-containing protein [Myxococcales bacterium]
MDERWLVSRRALLGGLGATALVGGWPGARAGAQTVPSRLLIVHVPEGMWARAPRPRAGAMELGPILEPLQPFQRKVLVLNGLNMRSRDHGPGGDEHHRAVPHMLTGTEMLNDSSAGGRSIDQHIAQAIGGDSRHASLHFAVRIVYGDTNSRPLWSAPGRVVPAMQNPWDAYNRIFGDVMPEMPTGEPPSVGLKKSALDYSLAQLKDLRARLPGSDVALLDSYHDSLRDIERRLGEAAMPATSGCALPEPGRRLDAASESNYPEVGRLQMDLIVSALQCGLTRVATLQWGNSNDQCSYSFLGVNTLGHDLAHNNNNVDPTGSKKLTVFRWYSEQFAYLLQRLDGIPEGEGTMLDHTVVLWASEFGESNGHSSSDLMWVLMGNADGYFNSGRVVDCRGRSTNDLHTSLCQAFGLPDEHFGNRAYCDGPLPNVT